MGVTNIHFSKIFQDVMPNNQMLILFFFFFFLLLSNDIKEVLIIIDASAVFAKQCDGPNNCGLNN